MTTRRFNLTDRIIAEFDHALRVVTAKPQSTSKPDADVSDTKLSDSERQLSARLMRVNHTGEIAAQALYRGQAMVTSNADMREQLLEAADEEHDHLAWCQQRTEELGDHVSFLAPLWYLGSFGIGAVAGLAGDKFSLGFLGETERQVTEHLEEHLQRLPATDAKSRAIIEQMRADEIRHGEGAMEHGGAELPKPVKKAMQLTSKVMTGISYRV